MPPKGQKMPPKKTVEPATPPNASAPIGMRPKAPQVVGIAPPVLHPALPKDKLVELMEARNEALYAREMAATPEETEKANVKLRKLNLAITGGPLA